MATTKNVTYKEPARYFNEDMRKAAEKWEKENAGKAGKKAPAKPAAKSKPAGKKK